MITFLAVPPDHRMLLIAKKITLNLICLKFKIKKRKLMNNPHIQKRIEKTHWQAQRPIKLNFLLFHRAGVN